MPNPPVLLLTVAGLALFIYYYIVGDRERPLLSHGSTGGSSSITVDPPPRKNNNRRRATNSCDDCTICQERIGGETLKQVLHCGHAFHTRCIAKWAQHRPQPVCPNCREPISW